MKKTYRVTFNNIVGAWLETVEVTTESTCKHYIRRLAAKASEYQINRYCSSYIAVKETGSDIGKRFYFKEGGYVL